MCVWSTKKRIKSNETSSSKNQQVLWEVVKGPDVRGMMLSLIRLNKKHQLQQMVNLFPGLVPTFHSSFDVNAAVLKQASFITFSIFKEQKGENTKSYWKGFKFQESFYQLCLMSKVKRSGLIISLFAASLPSEGQLFHTTPPSFAPSSGLHSERHSQRWPWHEPELSPH